VRRNGAFANESCRGSYSNAVTGSQSRWNICRRVRTSLRDIAKKTSPPTVVFEALPRYLYNLPATPWARSSPALLSGDIHGRGPKSTHHLQEKAEAESASVDFGFQHALGNLDFLGGQLVCQRLVQLPSSCQLRLEDALRLCIPVFAVFQLRCGWRFSHNSMLPGIPPQG